MGYFFIKENKNEGFLYIKVLTEKFQFQPNLTLSIFPDEMSQNLIKLSAPPVYNVFPFTSVDIHVIAPTWAFNVCWQEKFWYILISKLEIFFPSILHANILHCKETISLH